MKQIRKLFEILENDFPHDYCNHTARAKKIAIDELNEVAGYYSPILFNSSIIKWNHSWAYDEKRELYINITHDQFVEFSPRIAVFKETTGVLSIDENKTQDQINTPNEELGDIIKIIRKRII